MLPASATRPHTGITSPNPMSSSQGRRSMHWVVHCWSLLPLESPSGVFRGSSGRSPTGQLSPGLLDPALLESLNVSALCVEHAALLFFPEALSLKSAGPARCSSQSGPGLLAPLRAEAGQASPCYHVIGEHTPPIRIAPLQAWHAGQSSEPTKFVTS